MKTLLSTLLAALLALSGTGIEATPEDMIEDSGELSETGAIILVQARMDGKADIRQLERTETPEGFRFTGEAAREGEQVSFAIDPATGLFLEWEAAERDGFPETDGTGNAAAGPVDVRQPGTGDAGAPESPGAEDVGNPRLIGTAGARSLVLEKAGGGTVRSIKLDWERGRQVYEGTLIHGSESIEFEVDAMTGEVVEWEIEPIAAGPGQPGDDDDDDDDDRDDHDDDHEDDHDDDPDDEDD